MAVQQMNITLSPQMVRFIRSKVEKGEYTNSSEVVRDALRRMQEVDAAKANRPWLAHFEDSLPKSQGARIKRRVSQGILDIASGNYVEYDAASLKGLARELVASSVKKAKRPAK